MAEMIDLVEAKVGKAKMVPIFITCDPARDSPAVVKSYLKEFHAGMLGLTGTWEQVKQVCKAYRVYFSTPSGVKPGMDYLVDHSIYFYLMGKWFPGRETDRRELARFTDDGNSVVQIRRGTLSRRLDGSIVRRRRPR